MAEKKGKGRQQEEEEEERKTGEQGTDTPDYLDEYLERLRISRDHEHTPPPADGDGQQQVSRFSFFRLLLLFMSIMSMAKLLNKNHDGNAMNGVER